VNNPNNEVSLVLVPNFTKVDEANVTHERFMSMGKEDSELDEAFKQQQLKECCSLMRKSIQIAMATAFVKHLKTTLKVATDKDALVTIRKKLLDIEEKEYVSTAAMVVTEAIYKFVRRNINLQHLDLTRCNLS
jgi:uncharacterized protein YfeS